MYRSTQKSHWTLSLTLAAAVFGVGLLSFSTQPAALAKASSLWSTRSGKAPLAAVPDFSGLAKQLMPAVVSIAVETKLAKRSRSQHPFFPFSPFEDDGQQPFARGVGTGFVIHKDGLILTNNHVIENARSIEVTFQNSDGSEQKLSAKVIGTAPEYDVALLQTDAIANAPIAYLGDSAAMHIGDWVMAIGNPFGLSHSVSVGIVSAKSRRDIAPSGRRGVYDFIQTDASINPGNSGGPLINMKGEVIGINTAVNAAGSGIGFAIPIDMVKAMLPDLKARGKFVRSWIGIRVQPLDRDLAASYGLKNNEGALVSEVVINSPAQKAGIQDGDIVIEFDGKPIRKSNDLPVYAGMAGVGTQVDLVLLRSGKRKKRSIMMEAFPDEKMAVAGRAQRQKGSLGLKITDVEPERAQKYGIAAGKGVAITEVSPASPAQKAGLQINDVILSLNGKALSSAQQFSKMVKTLKPGAALRMQVWRSSQNGKFFVAMRKPKK